MVNTNKLRKIDDSIRRTIMIKLNRETVSLTCEVNELRKEKKKLNTKITELKRFIEELSEGKDLAKDYVKTLEKNNVPSSRKLNRSSINSDTPLEEEIVPTNISIIRSKPSKHLASVPSKEKLLPFQVYHKSKSKPSLHSKQYAKSYFEESSTQLPSILPSLIKGGSIIDDGSGLFSVGEIIGSEKDLN